PTIINWYPKHLIKLREITELFPNFNLVDLEEKQRLDDIARLRRRGKGAPKKGLVTYLSREIFMFDNF
ncbi:1654_t:CDS:1, partial [Acaulospora morrowiae]